MRILSKARLYTKEEENWLINEVKKEKQKGDKSSWKRITEDFEKEFGFKRNLNALRCKAARLGYKFKNMVPYKNYTKEQEEWLKKYSRFFETDKLAKTFNVIFGDKRTTASIRVKCSSLGLSYKKREGGDLSRKPIGTISYFEKRKETSIKIGHPNKWISLQKYMWQVYHKDEELGDRMVLMLDQNPYNFRKENLVAIDKSTLIIINRVFKLSKNADINKTILLLAKIKEEANKLEVKNEEEASSSS